MTPLAAYLLLFVAVGVGFILVHLVAGSLLRPSRPDAEKDTIYECGEPTIGSAWIQFDIRYYVVALLFVVFDVEVAFFFPWAEVFGKANAVANLPDPKTTADLNKVGATMLELDLRPGSAGGAADLERRKWQALHTLTPQGHAALHSLGEDDRKKLEGSNKDLLPLLVGVPAKAYAAFKAEAARLAPALKEASQGRQLAVRKVKEALEKEAKDAERPIPVWVERLAGESEEQFATMTLAELNAVPAMLAGDVVGPGRSVREQLKGTPELKKLDEEGDRLNGPLGVEVRKTQATIRAALAAEGVRPRARERLPEVITPQVLAVLGSFSAEQAEAVGSGQVTYELLQALSTQKGARSLLPVARTEAWWVAAFALVEVLVFFGVLLVGFAYLWRRGDLQWVRSMAAERPAAEAKAPELVGSK